MAYAQGQVDVQEEGQSMRSYIACIQRSYRPPQSVQCPPKSQSEQTNGVLRPYGNYSLKIVSACPNNSSILERFGQFKRQTVYLTQILLFLAIVATIVEDGSTISMRERSIYHMSRPRTMRSAAISMNTIDKLPKMSKNAKSSVLELSLLN